MSNQEKYRELCKAKVIRPRIFSQPWWLDIVCGGARHWDAVFAYDKGGNVTGVMPFTKTSYLGIDVVRMPKLTPFLDISLNPPDNLLSETRKQAFEQKVLAELIHQLPKVSFFSQHYHYELTNWLPFYWQGNQQTTMYSYVLPDLSDLNLVFDGFKAETRNMIRRAEALFTIQETEDIETFWRLQQSSLQYQNKKLPYDWPFFNQLNQVLTHKKARKIYFAKDDQNRIVAANYIVYDDFSAYNLASGLNRELLHTGAVQLILWYAIQRASERVNVFDFEGSMIEGIETFFSSFGGQRQSYYKISRFGNKLIEMLNILRR